jgi:hypothetical protein
MDCRAISFGVRPASRSSVTQLLRWHKEYSARTAARHDRHTGVLRIRAL